MNILIKERQSYGASST